MDRRSVNQKRRTGKLPGVFPPAPHTHRVFYNDFEIDGNLTVSGDVSVSGSVTSDFSKIICYENKVVCYENNVVSLG
jgi:hypothetical protein